MELALRKCKECGELFKPVSVRQQYCKKVHYRPCPVCGKLIEAKVLSDPPRCCSIECTKARRNQTCLELYGTTDAGNSEQAKAKRRATNLERYGVDNPAKRKDIMDRQRNTILKRYGVTNISQSAANKDKIKQIWSAKSDDELADIQHKREDTCMKNYGVRNPRQSQTVQDKTKQTLMSRYGVDCSLLIPEAKEKAHNTMMSRYGVLNPGQSEQIRKKAEQTCISKYGVPKYSMTLEFKEKFERTMLERYGCTNPMQLAEFQNKAKATNLNRYGVPAAFLTQESIDKARNAMLSHNNNRISKPNRTFSQLLTAAGVPNEFEFYLEGRWYDIVIPESKILIEIDPTYTHSTQPNVYGGGLDKNYHRDKSNLAAKHGYRCIHVFDWDDITKLVGLVAPVETTYYGRSVSCKYITESDCNKFLDMYHVQGKVRNQEVCLGLVTDEDELLSVMSFGRPRYNKNVQWELYRYATQFKTSVVGGASKLFKHFIDDMNPQSIVSYCDLSKFSGRVYHELGFILSHKSQPTKVWSKGAN